MQIPILVEPLPEGRGYRAKAGGPFDMSAERSTLLEAVDELERLIRDRLNQGAKLMHIEIGRKPLRIRTTDGLPNDETTREWLEAVEEYRRQVDEEDRKRLEALEQTES